MNKTTKRLSAKQYDRIDAIAEQLIRLADDIANARPRQSEIIASFGQAILNSCRPTQTSLRLDLPEKIDVAKIGSSVVFYLNQ